MLARVIAAAHRILRSLITGISLILYVGESREAGSPSLGDTETWSTTDAIGPILFQAPPVGYTNDVFGLPELAFLSKRYFRSLADVVEAIERVEWNVRGTAGEGGQTFDFDCTSM